VIAIGVAVLVRKEWECDAMIRGLIR